MKVAFGFAMMVMLAAVLWAQAPAAPPAGQTPIKIGPGATPAGFEGSAYGKARDIPARIVNFEAKPASIKPGQSVTLVWLTENPSGVTIDPDFGRVMPRGSRQVTPTATTTYTLTARGPNNQVLTKAVTVTVAGTTPRAAGASADARKAVPRTADGKPDLTGVYGGGGGGGARGAAGAAAPAGPVLKAGAEKFRIVRGPE